MDKTWGKDNLVDDIDLNKLVQKYSLSSEDKAFAPALNSWPRLCICSDCGFIANRCISVKLGLWKRFRF